MFYLMSIDSDRNSKGPGQSKVSQFNDSFVVNQQILWLQITMEDPPLMTEQDGLHNLVQVTL